MDGVPGDVVPQFLAGSDIQGVHAMVVRANVDDSLGHCWREGWMLATFTTPEQRRRALAAALPRDEAPLAERWIASRLSVVTAEVTRLLADFNFAWPTADSMMTGTEE